MTHSILTITRNPWVPLLLIAGAFVVLCGVYTWATPILEASDERWHVGMVDYIANNNALPVQNPDVETAYEQEGSQPPLYYILSALIVRGIDRSDFPDVSQPNPHARVGIPGAVGNKNMILHNDLTPPLRGTPLAVYLLRGFSIVLGTITIVAVYQTARQLGSNSYAALTAGITAFNPMFVFITASVNNDNLVTMLNSLAIWQLIVMAWRGFNWRRSAFIAVVVALASLSKLSGNVLVPVIALAAAYIAWRDKNWRGFITLGVIMVGVWAVFSGWWYVRNIQLYGELFGTHMMVQVAGPRLEPFTVGTLFSEFEGFRVAYWGLFGGVNVLTFDAYYQIMDVVTLLAVIGLGYAAWQVVPHLWRTLSRYRRPPGIMDALNLYWVFTTIVFVAIFVTASVSLIAWTAQTYASQGRLLFPYVAAISPLLASGMLALWPRPKWELTTAALVIYGVFALVVPFVSIRPAYTPPPPLTGIPADVNEVYARYGDVELIGYQTPDQRYQPGDDVPITVYWRVIEPTERNLSAFLTAVDPAGEAIGTVDTYPGGGTLRTSTWEPGAVYADTYAVPLRDDAQGQFDLRLQVGWWHYPTETRIEAQSGDGTPLESIMLSVGGFSGSRPKSLTSTLAQRVTFGGQIQLTSYDLNGNQLQINWQARSPLDDSYTVFVQVLDGNGSVVGQGDAPPALSTQYWQRGDVVQTAHTITYPEPVPAGEYTVIVGWYHPTDFTRLDLRDHPDNAYPLTQITVP